MLNNTAVNSVSCSDLDLPLYFWLCFPLPGSHSTADNRLYLLFGARKDTTPSAEQPTEAVHTGVCVSVSLIIRSNRFSFNCYADDTQLYFPPRWLQYLNIISNFRTDISVWMRGRHLQVNLLKTELVLFPANSAIPLNINIQLDSSSLTPTKTARNWGVLIDDQLNFSEHVKVQYLADAFTESTLSIKPARINRNPQDYARPW